MEISDLEDILNGEKDIGLEDKEEVYGVLFKSREFDINRLADSYRERVSDNKTIYSLENDDSELDFHVLFGGQLEEADFCQGDYAWDGYNNFCVNTMYAREKSSFLDPDTRGGSSVRPSLIREYNLLSRLYSIDPENVIRPLSLVQGDGGFSLGYLVEYVPGYNLVKSVKEGEVKSEVTGERIIDQVETALTNFHEEEEVHGDFDSRNVLLTPEKDVKIIDPIGSPFGFETGRENDLIGLKGIKKLIRDTYRKESSE